MFIMFAIFAAGIMAELVFVLPVIWTVERVKGHNPSRLQSVHRFLFSIWLWLMGAFGLLQGKPSKGKCVDGPCIIIANHPGLFDVLFLIRDIPKLTVMAKRSLTQWLPMGPIFKLSGYILSPEKGAVNPAGSLLDAMEKINMGYKFFLFPEGTRSPVGGLRPFKAGAFKIAQRLNLPLQPVVIRNIPPFLPKGSPWYLPDQACSTIEIKFLEAVYIREKRDIRMAVKDVEHMYRRALRLPAGGDAK